MIDLYSELRKKVGHFIKKLDVNLISLKIYNKYEIHYKKQMQYYLNHFLMCTEHYTI